MTSLFEPDLLKKLVGHETLVGGDISPVYYSMDKGGPGFNAYLLKDILDMLFHCYF
jgi:hypothetical protein